MRRLILLMITAITFACHAGPDKANQQTPYQSQFLVHDKSKQTLDSNTANAFYHVLSKSSGKMISSNTTAQPNIQSMVERYHYNKIDCLDDEHNRCYQLVIHFNEEAINSFMHNNEIAPWNGPRPSTLIWLQKKSSSGMETLNEYHPEAQRAAKQAMLRDMIILFPNGDISDQQIMPDEAQTTALEFLTSKYQAQQILYGIVEQENTLKISWHLFHQTHQDNWESTSSNLEDAISGALDHVVNRSIANITENKTQTINKTVIEIQQLSSYDAYNQLSNLLLSQDNINKVNIITIGANFFTIEITHQGTAQQLLTGLQDATYLQSNIESPQSEQAISSYQWIPPSNN